MEPYSTTGSNRAEAERWLVIAEKLLASRDLVGCKTFAIRARESEQMLDAADLILAVADTLIAGEKRVNNQHDWYAILQLDRQTRDADLIATHYRRLAILLNPHRNRLPFADLAFKLVSDAWSVLSNPSKKSIYDNELTLFSKFDPAAMSRGQEHPEQQQQQHAERQSPRNDNTDKEKNVTVECELPNTQQGNSTFWTACPYCYNMYEYPSFYEECTLRCQNCRRAFHSVKIPVPPPIVQGKEAYFNCWGFYPLGVSMSNLDKNKGGVKIWTPFSPMFTCPQFADGSNVAGQNVNGGGQKNLNVGGQKNVNARKSSAPRIYIDDDDVYVEISESSEESDDEWGSTRKKKKTKNMKGKGSAGKNVKKPQGEKAKNVKGVSGDNLQGGSGIKGVTGAPSLSNAETSRKAAANSAKKQTGKVPKEWGKLDLNVEFSNEVEEPAPGMSEGHKAGNGEEDGIEGIGFFEGLDEFLSSLPILNVVGDDKVKAA